MSGSWDKALSQRPRYYALFDLGRRPGTGLKSWAAAVSRQLERVADANERHRRNEPDALDLLQAEVYGLVMVTNRVRSFVELMRNQTQDGVISRALLAFDAAHPAVESVRDRYEHLDEYVRGKGRLHKEAVSPVLQLEWATGDVFVCFGPEEIDVLAAGVAAIALAETIMPRYDELLTAARPDYPDPPEVDDGVMRFLEVNHSVSAVRGRAERGEESHTDGTLRDTWVREATPEEIAAREAD